MKKNFFCALICIILFSGCSLFPKRVEYFQDKVEKFPTQTATHKDVQKQAAAYVSAKTKETVIAAIKEDSSTNVLAPALDAELVSDSLSGSMGKPSEPWLKTSKELQLRLDALDAKLDRKVSAFKEDNDENAGKKIEGTGMFSMSYFTQFIVLGGLLFVGWIVIKVLGTLNPGVQIGSQILSGGFRGVSSLVRKGFKEIVEGGEEFKKKIEAEIEDPETKERILTLFKQSQKEKQSRDVQDAIRKLTNPDVE